MNNYQIVALVALIMLIVDRVYQILASNESNFMRQLISTVTFCLILSALLLHLVE